MELMPPKLHVCVLIWISVKSAVNGLTTCTCLSSVLSASLFMETMSKYNHVMVVTVHLWLTGGGCDMLDHLQYMIKGDTDGRIRGYW